MIADSLQAEALLEYICRHPGEDDTRLALADVLEERGEDARATFIRIQCELANDSLSPLPRKPAGVGGYRVPRAEATRRKHRRIALQRRERELINGHMPKWLGELPAFPGGWLCVNSHPNPMLGGPSVLFRRGFPAEVSLTALAFAGGPCRACMEPNEDVPHPRCRVCHGKGCPGHAAALFRGAPIEKVTLDREPYQGTAWARQDRDDGPNVRWALPPDLFDCLPDRVVRESTIQARCVNWVEYQDTPTAHDALDAAALLYGRRRGWPCPKCDGSRLGVFPADHCPDCKGRGHAVEA